jgi:IclR family acetate operon transcriptional repressor
MTLTPTPEAKPAYDVPAARVLIRVAEALATAREPIGVTDVARAVGTNKNMAYRLLVTLVDEGWVIAEGEPPKYRLSLRPFHIFSRPVNRLSIRQATRAPLEDLHRRTGESVYLSVLVDDTALHVDFIDGVGPIRIGGTLGEKYELHASAMGKVLLAHAPADVLPRLVAAGLPAHTERTITDPAALSAHLAEVRTQGYALNVEEYGRGLYGCAAPVFDMDGAVVAALGMTVPSLAHTEDDLRGRLLPEVVPAARQASRNMGFEDG